MSLIGLALLVALSIPIIGLLVDSPIGRAVAKRLERGQPGEAGDSGDLVRRFELLEADVESLQQVVGELREENQFLQRLLEDTSRRPALPPDGA